MGLLSRIREAWRDKLGPGSQLYSILKPCYRCSYQKSHDPILIFSFKRGVRVVVNYNGSTYARREGCLGFKECGLCLEVIKGERKDLPCVWLRI